MTRAAPSLSRILTRRLTLIATAIVALNVIIVGAYYGTDRRELENEAMVHEIERLQAALVGTTLPADAALRALYADHQQAYAFALVDRDGTVLEAMNANLIPPFAMRIFADIWVTRPSAPASRLVVAGQELAGRSDGLRAVFVMAADPANLLWRAFVREFYRHVALPVLPMALVLIVAGALFLRRGLAPVASAAAWARNLRPGAPPPPLAMDKVPAEIADLIDATQRALDRLTQALAAEKRHAAEAAHALRTPVAVLVARLDGLPPGEAADQLRADVSALSRTVQQVLAASRTEAVDVSEGAAVDLAQIAETVTATLAPFAHAHGVDLSLSGSDAPVMAFADAEGVEVALSNLVENAILHGKGPVDIAVGPAPTVRVRDHGPGLPAGVHDDVFEPFWRGPHAPPGGAGLGLAIVERLQRAQDGAVEVHTPTGGGLAVLLSFRPAKI